MTIPRNDASILGLVVLLLLSPAAARAAEHDDLLPLLNELRVLLSPTSADGVPDYSAPALAKQRDDLSELQRRLAAIDPRGWPVSDQIDYHLVRAEMNGMEFFHRVSRPWARDPSFYLVTQSGAGPSVSDFPDVEGLPLRGDDLARFRNQLKTVPAILKRAETYLNEGASDFVTLALHHLREEVELYSELATMLAEHHPDLVDDALRAEAAVVSYGRWLEANQHRMTAPAGVGKDNYNWLLKNVYLLPYTWEEVRMIVELEDNRVITFLRLEENRNRDVPPIEPVRSQAEYRQSVRDALDHMMRFLREEDIFTMHDYLVPGDYFVSWHGFDDP